jgi:hypothetical protein
VGHLSRYCIDTKRPAGLVFGFGAFDEREIDAAARVLAGVLERESSAPVKRAQSARRRG